MPSRSPRGRALASLALVVVLHEAAISSACAQSGAPATTPTPDARTLFERASAAFARGDYEAAAADFRAAYALDPRPVLLLNAAQAFRLQRPPDCEGAQRHYELYLEAEPSAPERAEIERHIRVMRACVAASRDAAAREAARVPAPSPVASPPPAAPRPSAAPWLVGAGVGAAAAGTTLYLLARHRYHELEPTCPCPSDRLGPWPTITRVGYGLWIAGGVATVTGALWWWATAPRDERAARSPRVLTWFADRGAGLAIQGAFR